MALPSAITSQTRKKRREFNLGRSVSHGQSGPCACQRLGERGVNHDTQPTTRGLQVWLFKHPVNRNIVDVKEKVSDIVRRPCEDTKQVFFIWQIQTIRHHTPLYSIRKTTTKSFRPGHRTDSHEIGHKLHRNVLQFITWLSLDCSVIIPNNRRSAISSTG